jgi:hypothetical protein
MRGEIRRNRATIREAFAAGRVKKIGKSLWDINRDLGRLFPNGLSLVDLSIHRHG